MLLIKSLQWTRAVGVARAEPSRAGSTPSHSRFLAHVGLVLLCRALPAQVPQEELPGLAPQAGAQTLGGRGGGQLRGASPWLPAALPCPAPPTPRLLTPEKIRAFSSGSRCRQPSGPKWPVHSSSVTGGARSTAGLGPSSTWGIRGEAGEPRASAAQQPPALPPAPSKASQSHS